jgi:hypothetical protein
MLKNVRKSILLYNSTAVLMAPTSEKTDPVKIAALPRYVVQKSSVIIFMLLRLHEEFSGSVPTAKQGSTVYDLIH